MPETPPEPPIGAPIYDELRPAEDDQPVGEHVVITPFTAGSAGGAHTDSGPAGATEEN